LNHKDVSFYFSNFSTSQEFNPYIPGVPKVTSPTLTEIKTVRQVQLLLESVIIWNNLWMMFCSNIKSKWQLEKKLQSFYKTCSMWAPPRWRHVFTLLTKLSITLMTCSLGMRLVESTIACFSSGMLWGLSLYTRQFITSFKNNGK